MTDGPLIECGVLTAAPAAWELAVAWSPGWLVYEGDNPAHRLVSAWTVALAEAEQAIERAQGTRRSRSRP